MVRALTFDVGNTLILASPRFWLLPLLEARGLRPRGDVRKAALEAFLQQGVHVETGVYGAHTRVHLVNDGPVTLFLDSEERFRPR